MKKFLLIASALLGTITMSAQYGPNDPGMSCETAILLEMGQVISLPPLPPGRSSLTTWFELPLEDFALNHEEDALQLHFVNDSDNEVFIRASVYAACDAKYPLVDPEERTIKAHSIWSPSTKIGYNTIYNYYSFGRTSLFAKVQADGVISATAEYVDPQTGEPRDHTALHSLTISRGMGGSLIDVLADKGISANRVQLLDIMGRTISTDPYTSVSTLNAGIYIIRAGNNTIKLRVQ